MKESISVYLKTNSNTVVHFWYPKEMSKEQICLEHEKRGGNRDNIMIKATPDVNKILELGYKCYKLINNKFTPYQYNTLYHASNFNIIKEGGLAVFFFKTDNFDDEEPIVIGLHVVDEGVAYLRLPKELEYLKWQKLI